MKDNTSSIKVTTFGELLLRMHVSGGNILTHTKEFKVYTVGSEANVCILLSK
jgi:2-dehydro-3-deoxygluconokinase